MGDMISRCVVYARVSKEDQSNWSIQTQAERCLQYAAAQGWIVDEVFVDEGQSGTTKERKEFKRMLAHVRSKRKRIGFVLVYALSRFTRNLEDHLTLRRELNAMGAQLRSVTERFDDGPDGYVHENITALFADHYSRQLSARVTEGMKAAISRGRWPYRAALGYRNALDAAGLPTFEPDPERAPLVRQAFEMAADGRAPAEILRHVRSHGLTTKTGKPINAAMLAKLLRNPIYAGMLRLRKWGIDAQAAFVPLVEVAVFFRAQSALRRKGSKPLPQKHNPDFPLKGFVRCECGRPLVGYWAQGRRSRHAYYECQACNVRERRADLEDAFVEMMNDAIPPPEIWAAWKLEVLDVLREEERSAVEDAANLGRRAAALRERKERLAEGFILERAMDRPTYESLLNRADEELQETEAALAKAQGARLDVAGLLDYSIRVITRAGELWQGCNLEQRLGIQSLLFMGGVVWGRQNGFHRTAPSCLNDWVSADSDAAKVDLVEQSSARSNRIGKIIPFLERAEYVRRLGVAA